MKSITSYPLKKVNSFAVESFAPIAYFPKSVDDLIELAELQLTSFYILGEGCNTLFVQHESPIIIKPEFKGITIEEQLTATRVTVAAAENWHDFVCLCIEKGIYGLENLALIPGSVGAAPIQNIGAYGVEMAQYCEEVLWFDFTTKQCVTYKKDDCEFGYRESIFKNKLKNKGIIINITFSFPHTWQANLSYAGLNQLPQKTTAKDVMQAVIEIRQSKLPDPVVLPNAGSFFKNPTVERIQWKQLIDKYPNMPSYPQSSGKIKIAAGWLIDQVGLKGYQIDGVGIHQKQALVLVNYHAVQGEAIVKLALFIKDRVQKLFNINLEPEVRAVFPEGEMNIVERCNG